jgi:hypothetical protein
MRDARIRSFSGQQTLAAVAAKKHDNGVWSGPAASPLSGVKPPRRPFGGLGWFVTQLPDFRPAIKRRNEACRERTAALRRGELRFYLS